MGYEGSKKVYEAKQKKYGLPDFDELIIRFGINSMDWPEHLVLYNVLAGMYKRMQVSSMMMEMVLTGQQKYSAMYENKMLSKEEKLDLKKMWAKMNSIMWSIYLGQRSTDEKHVASIINHLYEFHKDEYMPFATKHCSIFESKWRDMKVSDKSDTPNFYE